MGCFHAMYWMFWTRKTLNETHGIVDIKAYVIFTWKGTTLQILSVPRCQWTHNAQSAWATNSIGKNWCTKRKINYQKKNWSKKSHSSLHNNLLHLFAHWKCALASSVAVKKNQKKESKKETQTCFNINFNIHLCPSNWSINAIENLFVM